MALLVKARLTKKDISNHLPSHLEKIVHYTELK